VPAVTIRFSALYAKLVPGPLAVSLQQIVAEILQGFAELVEQDFLSGVKRESEFEVAGLEEVDVAEVESERGTGGGCEGQG